MRTEKVPAFAAVLAILYPGLGHIYCGAVGLGIGIMLGPPILLFLALWGSAALVPSRMLGSLWMVFVLVYFLCMLWQVVDAYNLAERLNRNPHRDLERVFGGSSGRRAQRSTRRPVSRGRRGSRRRRGSR